MILNKIWLSGWFKFNCLSLTSSALMSDGIINKMPKNQASYFTTKLYKYNKMPLTLNVKINTQWSNI